MQEERISSNESEGAFNDFIEDKIYDAVDDILSDGNFENLGGRGSEIIVEMDDIVVPTFSYGDTGGGGGGGEGGQGPGKGGGKIRFTLPFERFMELIAQKLKLPYLTKEGTGRIKEISYEFKTFAPVGTILDKKRTFKRALRTSVGTKIYQPQKGIYEVQFRRRDRRFKVPERVEKPKYNAVVFYMGDISYSTYGKRLEMEKRLVSFIQSWLDYNYGPMNVEHRFFVHDAKAYEVQEDDFYRVSNIGGTQASIVFDLIYQIAFDEYDTSTTNYYGFYFGDGELFDDDTREIVKILSNSIRPLFNRVGVVEVLPSKWSQLNNELEKEFPLDNIIRLSEIKSNSQTIDVIRKLFGGAL
ncbi:MAG: hypothetical protein COB67_01935 [SAR324 cluster bacterium]|uniref:DUF444 family protein n=1 Tax=SAR324 cluster bacterium TaxID=2024889 RepID=A0A2A4TAP5_9DELT|nr:MAG: hypothetical protein COB67_01935 [SAR324 cluster bacterium]